MGSTTIVHTNVLATREGLAGQKTATGWRINATVPYVALPSSAALRLMVKVTNMRTSKSVVALAESGVDKFGRKTNRAGIDLGEAVWTALGMEDNGPVDWWFC